MRLSAVFRYLLLYIDVTRLNYVMHALMPAWCAFIFACVLSVFYMIFRRLAEGKCFVKRICLFAGGIEERALFWKISVRASPPKVLGILRRKRFWCRTCLSAGAVCSPRRVKGRRRRKH